MSGATREQCQHDLRRFAAQTGEVTQRVLPEEAITLTGGHPHIIVKTIRSRYGQGNSGKWVGGYLASPASAALDLRRRLS